jgi:hypothetical protein
MNSAAKAGGAALLAGLALLTACSDRGPTDLYSQGLLGASQPGAQVAVVQAAQDSLNPATGLDGLQVWLKNSGPGNAVAPLTATLAVGPCATANAYGAVSATARFGSAGQVLSPGDWLRGQAVDASGTVQSTAYAFVVTYNLGTCAGQSVPFTLTITDSRGASWTSSFNGIAQ